MSYQKNFSIRRMSEYTMVILLIFALCSMISCKKDENEPNNKPVDYSPNITLIKPDTTHVVFGQGDEFLLSVTATSNAVSNASLTFFQVLRNFDNSGYITVLDSALNTKKFELVDYICKAHQSIGLEEWLIVVHDTDEKTDSINFTTEIMDLNPTIAFLSGEYEPGKERVDGDVTLSVGTEFVFGIAASKVSDQDLRRVLIERKFENVSTITVMDSAINTASFTVDIIVFAYPTPGDEDFEVTLWDKADKYTTISFTVTTTPAAPNITTYEDRILGAQESITGSSFASTDGTVYSLADAKANAAKIDFMYFFDATNLATIAAPDDAAAAQVFNNAQYGLQTWDVLNNTRFKLTTLSSAYFNAITSSTLLVIAAIQPTAPDQSKINNLSVGKVLAFETTEEKYGLIRIDNITGTEDGSIDITVKVQ